ncbi:MAG: hypothetical protein P0120_04495 [Nitrospira sp.]|nr:hypothetical protein [Nitrospira sp.]
MVREDKMTMSGKELRRVHVIRQVVEKRSTQREAGTLMGLMDRQIRRLMRRVKQEGDQGLLLVFDAPQARFDRRYGTGQPAVWLIRRASAVDLVRRLSELRGERLQALGRLEAEAKAPKTPGQCSVKVSSSPSSKPAVADRLISHGCAQVVALCVEPLTSCRAEVLHVARFLHVVPQKKRDHFIFGRVNCLPSTTT